MNYVFVGHGWNLKESIDLRKFNCSVIMLSSPTCLFEETNRKHKQLLIMFGSDLEIYKKKLLKSDSKISNDFCEYKEECPNLLLCTFPKRGETSASFLQEIGKVKSEEINKIFLLSEILNSLHLKNNGSYFTLIVYACRCPLDHFQIENMAQFGEKNEKLILEYLKDYNIEILNDNEIGNNLKCEFKIVFP